MARHAPPAADQQLGAALGGQRLEVRHRGVGGVAPVGGKCKAKNTGHSRTLDIVLGNSAALGAERLDVRHRRVSGVEPAGGRRTSQTHG